MVIVEHYKFNHELFLALKILTLINPNTMLLYNYHKTMHYNSQNLYYDKHRINNNKIMEDHFFFDIQNNPNLLTNLLY